MDPSREVDQTDSAGQPEPSEAVIENVNEESATHDHEDATTIQTASPAHTQDRTTQPKDDSHSQRASSFRVQRFADRQTLSGWFPQIDNDEKNNWRIWLSRRSRALMVQIGIIGLILMTNFGLTIFAVASYGSSNGVGLIYQGDCSNVKKLDQWLHLLINLLGTGMLSASNYCMQLQAAPTRANVDAAHAAKKWLDIGIPILRNLRYLSNWRRASWALLALSSIPVHLIYNSAVFQSLSSHNYTVAVIKDSFLANSTWSLTTAEANRAGDWGWNDTRVNPTNLDYEQIIRGMQQNASSYQEMNVSDCFALYDDYWQPQGNVLVLVKNQSVQTPPDDSLLMYVSIVPRSDDWGKNMWALGNGTGRFIAQSPPKPVTVWYLGPKHYEVARCLVQPPNELHTKCRFEYSPPIMFTICIMNFIKAFIMICIWYLRKWQDRKQHRKAKEVLYTLGDAVASFMRDPCEQTKDLGLSTKSDFLTTRKWKDRLVKQTPVILKETTNREAKEFSPTAKQWRSAASLKRWVILLCMCLLVIVIAAILLSMSFVSLRHRRFGVSIPELWDLGFGALTPYTYLVLNLPQRDPVGLITNVLLANLPQLVLSIVYIMYNTMLSTFLVQREFSRMYNPEFRKPLRVSEPVGIQSSSYFVSLPLRYGIPLYASSGVIHWLISQSLFLARIRAISADGSDDEANSFSTCGYSPIAVFIAMLAGLVIIVFIVAIGFRRYDGTMRMVSTNSLAISAACHVLEEDRASGYLLPVQWGAIQMTGGEGKCAFTTAAADTVKVPQQGLRYK
ncbi:hypothetical protein K456DRAFT_55561 [Colletotrichum gloeosporioides 23]|nr:hypothetical protein K456DRAFT_55561 [Colletotrichum gloeosporioides 23]